MEALDQSKTIMVSRSEIGCMNISSETPYEQIGDLESLYRSFMDKQIDYSRINSPVDLVLKDYRLLVENLAEILNIYGDNNHEMELAVAKLRGVTKEYVTKLGYVVREDVRIVDRDKYIKGSIVYDLYDPVFAMDQIKEDLNYFLMNGGKKGLEITSRLLEAKDRYLSRFEV